MQILVYSFKKINYLHESSLMYSYMYVSYLLKNYINKAMFYCILPVNLYCAICMFTVYLLCSRGPLGRMSYELKVYTY